MRRFFSNCCPYLNSKIIFTLVLSDLKDFRVVFVVTIECRWTLPVLLISFYLIYWNVDNIKWNVYSHELAMLDTASLADWVCDFCKTTSRRLYVQSWNRSTIAWWNNSSFCYFFLWIFDKWQKYCHFWQFHKKKQTVFCC